MKQSSRRNFLGQALTAAGTAIAAPTIINQATTAQEKRSAKVPVSGEMAVTLTMNGQAQSFTLEPRVTLWMPYRNDYHCKLHRVSHSG